jgi:4-amino-4-deoxy-L-arabinose transferase-like glycosyltransferase
VSVPRPALYFVGAVSLIRLFAASRFPLTGDEAYYWTWSRHLAYGYVDHPPMVAWAIALLSPFGRAPGLVRFPFVVCEAVTALALGAAAGRLARDSRAGAIAAVAFTLLPQTKLALAEALPDGPYAMFWALALYFVIRLESATASRRAPLWSIALGTALGGVLLSRAFGWLLVFGIAAYALAPKRRASFKQLWIAFVVAALLYAPFVVWNARHHYANFAFTLHDRERLEAFELERITILSSLRLLLDACSLWLLAIFVALRPKRPLLAWTALPLPTLLVAIAFFYQVESYWILGPIASLCVGLGIEFRNWGRNLRRTLIAASAGGFAYVTVAALFAAAPERTEAQLLGATHGALRGPFYSGAFAYGPLATEIRTLAGARPLVILTDRHEIASELSYAGLAPLLIGPSPQSRQWQLWQDTSPFVARALYVSYLPLRYDSEPWRTLASAYATVDEGPTLRPRYAGVVADTFYTAWCSGAEPGAVATLFEHAP